MSLPRVRLQPHRAIAIAGALALAALSLLATAGSAAATGPATTDTSPVNLSTNINMADGKAGPNATVVAGDARFEVLAPDVIRLEYSPGGNFLDQPTYNVLDRRFPVPPYTVTRSGGWLAIRTSGMVLRYQLGSGAFTPANTKMQLFGQGADGTSSVQPAWEWSARSGSYASPGRPR